MSGVVVIASSVFRDREGRRSEFVIRSEEAMSKARSVNCVQTTTLIVWLWA